MVLRIGIAGLGTVGSSLISLLEGKRKGTLFEFGAFEITAVCARSKNKERGFDVTAFEWFDDPIALACSGSIDVFVELIGGAENPARACVVEALKAKKHVVTANKALLAHHGIELARLAEENAVTLNYEASVAGGIPIIKPMRESLSGNVVSRVYGILNGTCNYILTRMQEEEISFETCLAEAQRLGYAEADPAFDIQGHDTAHKLAILTSLAFGSEINLKAVYIEGITAITPEDIKAAARLGFRIKLLGMSVRSDHGIEQRVQPTMVPKTHPIAGISGVTNAVGVDSDAVGSLFLVGAGAGGDATASSVLADLIDVARSVRIPVFGRCAHRLVPYVCAPAQAREGRYYLRLLIENRPGAIKAVKDCFSDEGISFKTILQDDIQADDAPKKAAVEVILMTQETTRQAIDKAVEKLKSDKSVLSCSTIIRVEK